MVLWDLPAASSEAPCDLQRTSSGRTHWARQRGYVSLLQGKVWHYQQENEQWPEGAQR